MTERIPDELCSQLLELARRSIMHGMAHLTPLPIDTERAPGPLRQRRASFVTLTQEDRLRGCIGSIEATRMLIDDIVVNAHAAAFRDPRFPPLRNDEAARTRLSVSVLSTPVPLSFRSEQELIDQLRPGTDGVILRYGSLRATFLPAVWNSLPDPADFLRELKRKAGIPPGTDARRLQAWRYLTQTFAE